jgi:hypothetical protein
LRREAIDRFGLDERENNAIHTLGLVTRHHLVMPNLVVDAPSLVPSLRIVLSSAVALPVEATNA